MLGCKNYAQQRQTSRLIEKAIVLCSTIAFFVGLLCIENFALFTLVYGVRNMSPYFGLNLLYVCPPKASRCRLFTKTFIKDIPP